MTRSAAVVVMAMHLSEALAAIIPKRRKNARRTLKPFPVTLTYLGREQALGVVEALHESSGCRISATGTWREQISVDGQMLAKLASKYPPDAKLKLINRGEALSVEHERSQFLLPGIAGIRVTPPPRNKKHSGPLIRPPDQPPTGRFAWNDTWLFSARVPFPQHRGSTEGGDGENS